MKFNNIKNFFEKNGFVKLKIFNKNKTSLFLDCLADIIKKKIFEIDPKFLKNKKKDNKSIVNEGMIFLDKIDHRYLVEIYNSVPKSNFFYNITGDTKLSKIISHLISSQKSFIPLHHNSDTLRMDPPGITPFLYGWHRDNNSNIPNSNFIQMWMPIVNNIDLKLGGLHIVEKSHKLNLETTHTAEEQRRLKNGLPIRAKYGAKIKYNGKLKKKIITAKVGEVVLFSSSLLHKSGVNKTKNKMRYVINTFYHDMTFSKWKYINMEQKQNNLKY